jgi:hypothetical protein
MRFEFKLTKSKLAGNCVDKISFDIEMHRFDRIAEFDIEALTGRPAV